MLRLLHLSLLGELFFLPQFFQKQSGLDEILFVAIQVVRACLDPPLRLVEKSAAEQRIGMAGGAVPFFPGHVQTLLPQLKLPAFSQPLLQPSPLSDHTSTPHLLHPSLLPITLLT